jgi:methylmalonyl-CoA/ethylmalonyl-CoA epimerase
MARILKEIDHIGIAVEDLEQAVAVYRDQMGMKYERGETVEEQKVKVAVLSVGGIHIELLQATSDDSPIAKFLSRGNKGVHHICYRVDDMDRAIAFCRERGLEVLEGSRRTGAGGAEVAFLHPRSTAGVLTELTTGARGERES